jgi:hypothetical protein
MPPPAKLEISHVLGEAAKWWRGEPSSTIVAYDSVWEKLEFKEVKASH